LFYFYKTPGFLKGISRSLIWDAQSDQKEIYLTFDDGPIPDLTAYVLDELEKFNAKATFFCVGDNIRKYPEIFQSVRDRGHSIGNHTFNHLKSWSTGLEEYIENVEECQAIIERYHMSKGKPLFRPPHGQVSPRMIKCLKTQYKIIMWDVLTYDFDNHHTAREGLERAIRKTRQGSIVVFHDNYKAKQKLKFMLPRYLEHFSCLGYDFKKLS
jgi:peptidoglycan/xylan/chitin deacetylase (PgdA/CDA1 family)